MNNIERFRLLTELQAKKAELHKENFLEHFDWSLTNKKDEIAIEKLISYGKTGYSLYQMFSKLSSKNNSEKES